jgi:molybdate transport system regulatory protein
MTNLIVRIDLGPHGRLGTGKLTLMSKIDELGSISAAGRAMKMSYRQAWALVDQLNSSFQEPVVVSQTGGRSGGGAHLTDFGKLLLSHCNAVIGNARKSAQPHMDFIDAVLKRGEAPAAPDVPKKSARKARK